MTVPDQPLGDRSTVDEQRRAERADSIAVPRRDALQQGDKRVDRTLGAGTGAAAIDRSDRSNAERRACFICLPCYNMPRFTSYLSRQPEKRIFYTFQVGPIACGVTKSRDQGAKGGESNLMPRS